MQISTYTLPQEEARDKYRELLAARPTTPLNLARKRVYYSLSKGRRIIDIYTAFQQAGLNELGQPRIAICRADVKTCYFHPFSSWQNNKSVLDGGGVFTQTASHWEVNKRRNAPERVNAPEGTFQGLHDTILSASVPRVPQEYEPKNALRNYYILWEVESWKQLPRDPLLLRRLSKNLFEILAEWELSDLEWSIARGAL